MPLSDLVYCVTVEITANTLQGFSWNSEKSFAGNIWMIKKAASMAEIQIKSWLQIWSETCWMQSTFWEALKNAEHIVIDRVRIRLFSDSMDCPVSINSFYFNSPFFMPCSRLLAKYNTNPSALITIQSIFGLWQLQVFFFPKLKSLQKERWIPFCGWDQGEHNKTAIPKVERMWD